MILKRRRAFKNLDSLTLPAYTLPMNTSNTFLRYFETNENGEEIDEQFVSIADLEYSGCPIDENGDDLDRDEDLYKFDGEDYQKIA